MLPFEDAELPEQPHKVLIHEFLKKNQAWSARADLFHHSSSASGFVNQHVMFHESMSISPYCVSSSLFNIIHHTQVGLADRVLGIMRSLHPHLEQVLFVNQEFRSDLKELEFSPSLTVENKQCQPLEVKCHGC